MLAPLDERGLPGDTLRALRAVAVREYIGSAEAEEALKKVAKDGAEDQLRREAEAALDRRPAARP